MKFFSIQNLTPFHVIHLSCGRSVGWIKRDLSGGVTLDVKKKKVRKGAKKIGGERKPKKKQEKARYTELSLCDMRTRNRIIKTERKPVFLLYFALSEHKESSLCDSGHHESLDALF